MRRRIRREGEAVQLGGVAQHVAHRAGLDAGKALVSIDRQHAIEVLRAVDDERDVHALPAKRGAAAAREDGHAVFPAQRRRGDDVLGAARQQHADGDLAVIRGVGGVRRPRAGIEAHLTRNDAAQRRFESLNDYHLWHFVI